MRFRAFGYSNAFFQFMVQMSLVVVADFSVQVFSMIQKELSNIRIKVVVNPS
jgi:hypothetical protein